MEREAKTCCFYPETKSFRSGPVWGLQSQKVTDGTLRAFDSFWDLCWHQNQRPDVLLLLFLLEMRQTFATSEETLQKLLITIDPELQVLRREAKTAHPWLKGATVSPRLCDWITNTSVGQPSPIAAVESRQLPGSVDLAHLGDLTSTTGTGLDGLREVQLRRGFQEINTS